MAVWYKSKVINIEDETEFVKRFFLAVEDLDDFDFLPGQFVTLDLPISDKRQKRWRSYSIASAPNNSNVIELCIVRKYDGAGTAYLFDQIKVGDHLTFKGPDGSFILPKSIDQNALVMICTGTGIAPFRAFVQQIVNHKLLYKKIHLIFGARYEKDILYRKEFEQLANQFHNFKFDIALSREENWVQKGYVHDIYINEYKNNIENTLFYLCGWTNMVDDAVANLIVKMGCEKSQVVYELYG
jgi:ferredoxin-NADP reductase